MKRKDLETKCCFNKTMEIWCGYLIVPNFLEMNRFYNPYGGVTLEKNFDKKNKIYGFDCGHLMDGPKGKKNFKTKKFVLEELRIWKNFVILENEKKFLELLTEKELKKLKKIINKKKSVLGVEFGNKTICYEYGNWIGVCLNEDLTTTISIRKRMVKKCLE